VRIISRNIPSLTFLGKGVFLLLRDHAVAGGFCLLVAMLAGRAE